MPLRIDCHQPAWHIGDDGMRAEYHDDDDGDGVEAARLADRPHPLHPDVTVRMRQPTRSLYTPSTGLPDAVLRALPDPTVASSSSP